MLVRAFAVLLVALSACSSKSGPVVVGSPPSVRPKLGARSGEEAPTPPIGPVQVTYFAPQGEASSLSEISVSFDRPMVALGSDTRADGVLAITPPIAGEARWVGSQTLAFSARDPLPMATAFTVEVAAGLRARDGQALPQPLAYTFATPALAVVRTEPAAGEKGVVRTSALDLYFNQAVSPQALSGHFALVARKQGRETPVEALFARIDPSDLRRVRVTPKKALPLGATVEATVTAGLRGEEGARALAADHRSQFEVYGPLRLLPSRGCRGSDCIAKLGLSNPVRMKALRSALRFDPPLARALENEGDYESDALYFGDELAPATSYRVRIEGPLRDVYGNALEGNRSVVIRTPPLSPSARVLLDGDLIQAGSAPPVPIHVALANLKDARITVTPLRAAEVQPLAIDGIRAAAPPIVQTLGAIGPAERKVVPIAVTSALSEAGRGALLVGVTGRGNGEAIETRTLLAVTDLAPTLKVGADGGVVWVTRIGDAQPVKGARVRVVDAKRVLASGTTDVDGAYRFTLPRSSSEEGDDELAALVEHEGDVSFVRKYAGVAPWALTDHASFAASGSDVAHLFTERGVYRPGDQLSLKGILRSSTKDGYAPARGEVALRVVDAAEREIARETLPLSPYGTFAHVLRIPGSAPLGPITAEARFGATSFRVEAEVAEYRPAELEVTLGFGRTAYVRGERAEAKVGGRFLFGAPARDGRALWRARYARRAFAPKEHDGFSFHDDGRLRDEDDEQVVAASGEVPLDMAGEHTWTIPLADAPTHGPSELALEASVVAGGAEVGGGTAVALTPAAVVAGIRPASQVIAVDRPLALALAALSPDGVPEAGVMLEATLDRRVFETQMVAERPVEKVRDQRVASCRAKSQKEPVRCNVQPTEPGLHVARVTARDRKGRRSVASVPIYVYGAGDASWGGETGPVIALKAARETYALGETAQVLVPSPFAEAEALMSVEREGVLSLMRQRIGRAGTIDVTIDERFVPNAFVSVIVVPALPAGAPASAPGPAYRVGTLELAADVSARRLAIAVEPDAVEKRPGEEVKVRLSVRDGRGRPTSAELTVFAVDEGVLALTGYRTPDPFSVLYAPRPLAVWTSDARATLSRSLAGADDQKGGEEGGGGGQLLRSNFAAVALFAPDVLTDADGVASVRFKLPDATTRYRIMAVAASRGAEVGAGEASVRTQKPLFARPLLPRVLRAGDTFAAAIAVHNEKAHPVDVEAALEASGLTLASPPTKSVTVPARGVAEVHFEVRDARVGEAQLTFHVRGDGERDDVTVQRAVRSPSVLETVSVAGASEAPVSEALAPLTEVRDDVGGLALTVTTSALGELEAPARSLLAYEYGCSEQLASRLVALAALEQLRVPLALADRDLGQVAAQLLSELERHQRADGSFGMWRREEGTPGPLAAFLTSYALIAFAQLADAGLAVAPEPRDRAKAFLSQYLGREADASLRDADRAFALYALARVGGYDASYAGKLFEERKALLPISRIELAHAFRHDPEGKARIARILDELAADVRVTADEAHVESNVRDAHAPLLISDVRATAALLLLLEAHAPKHVLVPKLARWLASARGQDGSWESTQASAWALMALGAHARAHDVAKTDLHVAAQIGRRRWDAQLTGARGKASFQLPMAELPRDGAALSLVPEGRGALHYAMRLSYAPRALPAAPRERGFFIERSYERIDAAALAGGAAKGELGHTATVTDYVRVNLRIAVPSGRRFVLITDPLPAGLEPVDFNLATTAFGAALRDGQGPHDHYELRDDRAVFAVNDLPAGLYRYSYLARAQSVGRFIAPPARVEEMYHAETQGLTAASTFTVEPRP